MNKQQQSNVKMVPIPRTVTDEFYRYKMPDLVIKVEGKGNGIKTVLVNVVDVAKALARPADFPTKYLGFQLGSLTTLGGEDGKYIVNGNHDKEKLCHMLDEFIDKYVLCKTCQNPETIMTANAKSETIKLACRACGAVTDVMALDKMGAYILKNPPMMTAIDRKMQQESRERREREEKEFHSNAEELKKRTAAKRHGGSAAAAQEAEDDGDWSCDVSPEAVAARLQGMLGNKAIMEVVAGSSTTPSTSTTAVAAAGTTPSPTTSPALSTSALVPDVQAALLKKEAVAEELQKVFQGAGGNNTKRMAKALMLALFAESSTDMLKQIPAKAALLKPFSTGKPEGQKGVFDALGDLLEKHQTVLPAKSVPMVFKALYDEDVLEEDNIIGWHDARASRPLAVAAFPFVNWLKNAEEEDEDD